MNGEYCQYSNKGNVMLQNEYGKFESLSLLIPQVYWVNNKNPNGI